MGGVLEGFGRVDIDGVVRGLMTQVHTTFASHVATKYPYS